MIHYNCGELYSTFDRDVNNKVVRLEVDKKMGDVRRISQLLELKVMHRSVNGENNSEYCPPIRGMRRGRGRS